MVYTIEINEKGEIGKSVLHLLKGLSKTSREIHFIETVEDDELLKEMKISLKSGFVSNREANKTLKNLLGK